MTPTDCRQRGEEEAARILTEHGPELPAWHSAMAQADWEAEAHLSGLPKPYYEHAGITKEEPCHSQEPRLLEDTEQGGAERTCHNSSLGRDRDTNKPPNTLISASGSGKTMETGKETPSARGRDARGRSATFQHQNHAKNAEQEKESAIISTATPQTTGAQTSLFCAGNATCNPMDGSRVLSNLPSATSQRLSLPDGIRPYYIDEKAGIAILHGDCREILPHIGPVDLVLTDPPYGIALANHARGKERSDSDWSITGDEDQSIGTEVINSLTGQIICFSSPMKPWPGDWKQFLVWSKGGHVSGGGDPSTYWKPSWELIQVKGTGALNGNRDSAVLNFPAVKDDYRLHPSPKPLAICRYLIGKTTAFDATILDPFMGSGTTLRAAKDLGRKAIGIEIEERYCEIAAKRLSQEVLDFGS